MTGLYLLAAHMLGDFVLSDRWAAARKLDDAFSRTRHVLAYCLPFAPVAFYAAPTWRDAVGFLAALYALHFLTDARRARSTLGDWVAWRLMPPSRRADEVAESRIRRLQVGDYHSGLALVQIRPSDEQATRTKVPPNPWEPIPILVDQALHLCQLALLGGLLLR